jgi:hypothetical protein
MSAPDKGENEMTYEQQVTEVTGETGIEAAVIVELMRDPDSNSGCLDHLSPRRFRDLAIEAKAVAEELKATDPECYDFYKEMAS